MGVKLHRLFTNGMVLQRGAAAAVLGTSDSAVEVGFLGNRYSASPDASGRWTVMLRDLAPGGPHTMTVNDIELSDIYIGDVWLCAGQSNMQFPMRRCRHMYPEEMIAQAPCIRQFTVPQSVNFLHPQDDLDGGEWAAASPESIGDFTAVGYFFAKRLRERYHVPIGLINTAIGGTPIHAWMSRDMLAGFPALQSEADLFAEEGHASRVHADNQRNADSFFASIDAADPGLAGHWYAPGLDLSGWQTRSLLTPWDGAGSVWFRKTVDIPPRFAGRPATLFLGTMIDWDMTYVEGVAIGGTTYRYPPREYAISALPAGRCTIAIRAISKNGGGFTPGKQFLIATDEGAIDLQGEWQFRRGASVAPPAPETAIHVKPTGLFNGMIAPLFRYGIRGAIWYQGESDAGHADGYAAKFEKMACGWRAGFGHRFPLLFTELANWGEGIDWHALRNEQRKCLGIPGTAMAAAFDLGEQNDLHPQSKRDVGDRLARCAMRVAYGERLAPSPFEVMWQANG